MSLIRIPPEFFEFSSLSLHPETTFTSSSKAQDGSNVAHTVTSHMSGSARLSARPSPFIKESTDLAVTQGQITFFEGGQADVTDDLESLSRFVVSATRAEAAGPGKSGEPGVNIYTSVANIMDTVHSRSLLPRSTKKFPIKRYGASDFFHEIRGFTTETGDGSAADYDESAFATGSIVKAMIQNSLLQFYRGKYDSCDYSYTNYHSLNFFTASNVPSDSVLIYPNSGALRGYSTITAMNPQIGSGFMPGDEADPDEGASGEGSGYLAPPGAADDGGGFVQMGESMDPPPGKAMRIIPGAGAEPPMQGIQVAVPNVTPGIRIQTTTPPYVLSGSFTFDFYINPRYHNGAADRDFKAGTILHLPNYYALSLVSGSDKDENGLTRGYRLLMQLAESCEHWEPSQIPYAVSSSNSTYKNQVVMGAATGSSGLLFVTPDNSLKRNHWHHVSVRWGTNAVNNGEGTIRIDDESHRFMINSASVRPGRLSMTGDAGGTTEFKSAGALFIGNYYSGSDVTGSTTNSARFFNSNAASAEGVVNLGFAGDPTGFQLDHPLNAEIHDVKIFTEYINDDLVYSASILGQSSTGSLVFYVPPLFVKESRPRRVLTTPFSVKTEQTSTPFNVSASFGTGGHILNLDNFTRDFITSQYPRLYKLTGNLGPTQEDSLGLTRGIPTLIDLGSGKTEEQSFNYYLYGSSSVKAANYPEGAGRWPGSMNSGSVRKRNLTVLPCDNGLFSPDYALLISGAIDTDGDGIICENETPMSLFVDDIGTTNLSTISLRNLVGSGGNPPQFFPGMASNLMPFDWATPENPSDAAFGSDGLSILRRNRDTSSQEVVIFDISNLYFGNRIFPGSFKIEDANLTGSNGAVKMTIRDNGRGSLYRADSLTPHPEWASVGNIFYNEGLVLIKSPNIPFFGKDQFKVTFKGEINSHILTVNVPCEKGLHNSSSNPQYQLISASFDANDFDPTFMYIDGINLHDDNLNVIMRAKLAQPIKKRNSDSVLFKLKEDF